MVLVNLSCSDDISVFQFPVSGGWRAGGNIEVRRLKLALAIRLEASPHLLQISSDRQARPRADQRLSEREKWCARQATPRFQRGYGTTQRSADVDYVQMILSATTERAGAFRGAVEKLASWCADSVRLKA